MPIAIPDSAAVPAMPINCSLPINPLVKNPRLAFPTNVCRKQRRRDNRPRHIPSGEKIRVRRRRIPPSPRARRDNSARHDADHRRDHDCDVNATQRHSSTRRDVCEGEYVGGGHRSGRRCHRRRRRSPCHLPNLNRRDKNTQLTLTHPQLSTFQAVKKKREGADQPQMPFLYSALDTVYQVGDRAGILD